MNPPFPRRLYYLLFLFGLLVCLLFAAATFFFPERSIERVSAYFILTMGTCVLMCATGLALTHRWIEQRFAAAESTPDTAVPTQAAIDSTATDLAPAPQTKNHQIDQPDTQRVASATN